MVPEYESFLDATPEKGVIVVEYWWQTPNRLYAPRRKTPAPVAVGDKTSMVFFRRILVADKCWCGSGRAFGRCHRRHDDWTFVTLDPDRQAYSPVVLVERTFPSANPVHARRVFSQDRRWLAVEYEPQRAVWALPAHPPVVNDIGQMVIGTVEISSLGARVETNSEERLEHLAGQLELALGVRLGHGETRRVVPQTAFHIPWRRR
jgi:hypothetical protein